MRPTASNWQFNCSCLFHAFLLSLLISTITADGLIDENTQSNPQKEQNPSSSKEISTRAKESREQWGKALKEIKELTLPSVENRKPENRGVFNDWKLLLDEPKVVELDPDSNITTTTIEQSVSSGPWKPTAQRTMPRFEGFASWERMLQEWAEDVHEYLDKIEAETTEYPMSTHGRPSKQRSDAAQNTFDATTEAPTTNGAPEKPPNDSRRPLPSKKDAVPEVKIGSAKKKSIQIPVPRPSKQGEPVLPHTDLADRSKRIWIVTTASLPWMTGTAVNPLLRAAYMCQGREAVGGSVTLMLPWLEREQDQDTVYGKNRRFSSPESQEQYIRDWLRDMAKMPDASKNLKIEWYTAWQNKAENSIYSMGDITALIPAPEVDIMILEEPEHLNWYRAPGEPWTDKFKHVIGIIHTNYFVYAQEQPAAFIRAPGMRLLCSWMCRAHCHRVIKLSGTLGQFAPEKELVENVHGVRGSFLETGEVVRRRLEGLTSPKDPVFGAEADPSVYFIGKMLWSKGLGSLMELLKYAEESAGIRIGVDMYGGGPNLEAAEERSKSLGLDMTFHGPIDHGELGLTHKIFINPSTSEVLCTTVAEALAMGKFVIVPSHPSNDFFAQFPNCLTYANKEEFVGDLYYALTHAPEPLTKEVSYALSWKAATERLESAGCIPVEEADQMALLLESRDAGIEISLPPFIEDDMSRKLLSTTIKKSRQRYRQFRSTLSAEIQQSFVLPDKLKQRMITELDKRLDLDIEDVLESPKLQIQLSPAELDKRLLELYNDIARGPRGDVLRVIVGGNDVSFQDLYIKRRAFRERRNRDSNSSSPAFGPLYETPEGNGTASQWVKRAIKRNLSRKVAPSQPLRSSDKSATRRHEDGSTNLKMSLSPLSRATFCKTPDLNTCSRHHFTSPQPLFATRFNPLLI